MSKEDFSREAGLSLQGIRMWAREFLRASPSCY